MGFRLDEIGEEDGDSRGADTGESPEAGGDTSTVSQVVNLNVLGIEPLRSHATDEKPYQSRLRTASAISQECH